MLNSRQRSGRKGLRFFESYRASEKLIQISILGGLIVAPLCLSGMAYGQDTSGQLPVPRVVPLPNTPPPTDRQAPLPTPTGPSPKADRPAKISPPLTGIAGRVPAQPIKIDDAVAIALANNRNLALAREALLRAQGRLSETRASFGPTGSLGFSYTRLNEGQSAVIASGAPPVTFVNADQPVLSGSIALPIDIAGLLRTAERQAEFQEVAQKIDINRTRNQIVLDTKTAFYNVLRGQALVLVAQETIRNSEDRLRDAQLKYEAGTVARFDVIRALTDVQSARQQLIGAQANLDNYLGVLNSTIGIAVDAPLSITSVGAVTDPPGVLPATATEAAPSSPNKTAPLPPATEPKLTQGTGGDRGPVIVTPSNVLGPEYRSIVQEALANRPEILEADAQIAAARKGIKLARRSLLPSVSLSINGQYSPDVAGFSPQPATGSFVASVSIPFFDAGAANARVTQARADVATAETNRRQAVDSVNLEVRSAYLNLLQARDRVAVANQALSEALEAYRLARVRYTNGVSTLVELSDAQNALTQSENNQVNALYDYNNARSTLDKAAGRYAYLGKLDKSDKLDKLDKEAGFPAPPSPKVTGKE